MPSMRSVTTKPPTTFSVPNTTATNRMTWIAIDGCSTLPNTTSAPTNTMPWMALVPDINGVCKVLGTLEITANPTNPDSTRIARLASNCSYIKEFSALVFCAARGAGNAGFRDHLVVEIGRQLAIGEQQVQQRGDVLRIQLAGVLGHGGRQVQRRGDRHVVLDDDLARFGELAVAAGLAGQVDHDAARLHALHGRGGHQPRRGTSRNQRGGDDDVETGDRLLEGLLLLRAFLVGELAGVAALSGGVDAEVNHCAPTERT